MPRRATITNAVTKGVIDPALSERIDLAHYYNALADGLNIECTPQGGFRRRPGSTVLSDYSWTSLGYKRRLRRRIEPINVTSGMITAHNGGTTANLVDQNAATLFTTAAVSGTTFVVAEIDLGAAREVVFLDVIGFKCAANLYNQAIGVEWWDGAAWVAVAGHGDPDGSPRRGLRTTSRTRRFGEWPGGPGGAMVSARNWRIVVYNAVGAGAISVAGIRLWAEKRTLSPAALITFARSRDQLYEMVLTERNIDVFRDNRYLASVPVDVDAPQIAAIKRTQSLDTLILYHEDVETPRVLREGADDEWGVGALPLTNVPTLSANTAFSGDQDEVQDVVLTGIVTGRQFVLWLGAVVTAPITYAGTGGLAAAVKAALETLPGVAVGVSVTLLSGATPAVRVTFTGANGARRWPVIAAVVLGDDDAAPETIIRQRGLDADGPLMGATTGWPRCGVVTQSRHIMAGFRGAPQTYAMSRTGLLYDYQQTASPLTADLAIVATLDTDQLETIHEVFAGRHIQIFTDSSEWYVESRTLDRTQPVNVLRSTAHGFASTTPVVFAEGSTLFVQRGGRVLRDMVFSDVELAYRADPLSLLAPHLLEEVTDVGYRASRSTDEGNQIYMVNATGNVVQLALMKDQEVIASAPWQTDGAYRAVKGDVAGRVWQIVERSTHTGGADLYLERIDDSHTLDAAIVYDRGGVATSVITDLDIHDGKEVWAWIDGDLYGPLTVSGGQVTLPVSAVKAAIGLFPPLRARLPTIREKLQNGYPFRPPARIYEVELALAGTGQIDLAVNGAAFRDVPLAGELRDINIRAARDTSGLLDAPLPAATLERLVRAVAMIPAAGEHVYATEVVTNGAGGTENMHNDTGAADLLVSLGQAREALPNLGRVSLFVAWFGDDLRCADCQLKPKTDAALRTTSQTWSVSGVTRATADEVSLAGSLPAYGGTPGDASVVQAIQAMKAQGLGVVFTPFVLMDVPAGNGLADPYTGSVGQPAYPWRGRITCHPAPGQPSTPDLTSAAATQVQTFVGTAAASDFAVAGSAVTYSGPTEWTYRRMILHYAHLCVAAGGVDTFVIGSEMRGLGWVRDAAGSYPFVDALVALAADVKAVLGASTKVTYAADWSEYFGHQTGVSGELYFHLDPLWASASIDAVGIDCYWPLADWRNGTAHADYLLGVRSPTEQSYLRGNIAGGEGFDWYYASGADRTAQTRTEITDGAYGKPWVWRYKDIKSWWSNSHFNRPAGVEDATPTAWVAGSKPIWFTEVGCPAVDKGSNQPNVFTDAKSAESALPYFSDGVEDDAGQRAYLEAFLGHFDPLQAGFAEEDNPAATLYAGHMVDPERTTVYTWDARFHPAFPSLADVWGDAPNWRLGHWITGRVSITTEIDTNALPLGLDPALPLRDRLMTGNVRVQNLRGWSRHPTIEISQSRPAPLEVRAIRYEVSHHG